MKSDPVLPESRGSTSAFRDAQIFKYYYPISEGLEQHTGQSNPVRSLQIRKMRNRDNHTFGKML